MSRLGVAIVKEYERGVVFRLGKLRNTRKPGMRFMIPLADRMVKVSLRTSTRRRSSRSSDHQGTTSRSVAAVAYYRRVDPVKSIIEVENATRRSTRSRRPPSATSSARRRSTRC